MTNDKHLDLIAKLLRQAEGTTHEAEASAFMERAQTLATRHSIDLAMARSHTAKAEKREEIEERTVVLGERGQNGLAKYVDLFNRIAQANDCRILVAADSTRVYVHGFPSDIEVVETLYASLVYQMVAAANAYLATGEYKSEKVWVEGRWKKTGARDYYGYREEEFVPGHYKPVHGKTARASFYSGFTGRIGTRLRLAKMAAEQEAVKADEQAREAAVAAPEDATNLPVSTALVLQEKKAEVDAHMAEYKRTHKIGTWRGGSRTSAHSSSASGAGSRAANSANIGGGTRAIGS